MKFPWRSRSQRDTDLDDEIRAHLRMAEADRVARGETITDAAHGARREFGNLSHVKEVTRETWHAGEVASRVFDRVRQDVGYALRGLRRSPGFTITIVLTLALGVGANSAIFSFLDRIFLRPPDGVRAPSEIRRLYVRSPSTRSPTGFSVVPNFHYPGYAVIRDALGPDAGVVAYTAPTNSSIPRDGAAIPITVSHVSPNYFRVLGVPIARGRYFNNDEERIEVPAPLVVISHALWSRAFGLDSSIVGREIQIGSRRLMVIGITEPGFTGVDVDATDAFIALSAFPGGTPNGVIWYQSGGYYLSVLTRVPREVDERGTLAQAAVAYRTQPEIKFSRIDTASTILAGPISSARGPQDQGQEVAISTRIAGVSIVVLLIACANMANLLLVRATRRRREIAVRLAMGVSRSRLFGQMVTESVCLALLGGIAAIGVAWWGGQVLRKMLLPDVHWSTGVIDFRVIAVTGFVALCIGIAGGIAPALQARRQNVVDALKSGSRDGTYQRSRLRAALLVVQAAFSIVLVAGAGLFVRSLGNVRDVHIGYDIDSVASVSAGSLRNTDDRQAFELAVSQLAERLASEPGVVAMAPASVAPMQGWSMSGIALPGRDSVPRMSGPEPDAQFNRVSPHFFSTVGMRVLSGRVFAENEPLTSVVVNEKMAEMYWPGQNPIGQCLILDTPRDASCSIVIGVVENAHRWRIVEEPNMQYFRPGGPMPALIMRIDPARWGTIAARVRAELATLLPAARNVRVTRMSDRLAGELRPWRMGAALFTAFGLLSLLVAAVGVYSVVAYGVSQRVQEMGVRIALGARAGDVISLIVGEGVRVVVIGAVAGIGIAIALGKFIAALLYGVTARDPGVLVASAVTLFLITIVAALLPAWRASRVDPVTALRAE